MPAPSQMQPVLRGITIRDIAQSRIQHFSPCADTMGNILPLPVQPAGLSKGAEGIRKLCRIPLPD